MTIDRVQLLRDAGVQIKPKTEWVGEPGTESRRQVDVPATVATVAFPFSGQDWCDIAMREGPHYVGGCCGNMSMLQDHMNSVFRDGGWADAGTLLAIGEIARGHDGFECFGPVDDDQFAKAVERFNAGDLDPWEKLGLVFCATEPMLAPKAADVPGDRGRHSEEEDAIWTLYRTLGALNWGDLFEPSDDEDRRGQHERERLVQMARLVQPLRTLSRILETNDTRLDGFALVKPGTDEVLSNGFGLCVYAQRAAAERVLELWARQAKEYPDRQQAEAEVVEVTITVADGLTVIRD